MILTIFLFFIKLRLNINLLESSRGADLIDKEIFIFKYFFMKKMKLYYFTHLSLMELLKEKIRH